MVVGPACPLAGKPKALEFSRPNGRELFVAKRANDNCRRVYYLRSPSVCGSENRRFPPPLFLPRSQDAARRAGPMLLRTALRPFVVTPTLEVSDNFLVLTSRAYNVLKPFFCDRPRAPYGVAFAPGGANRMDCDQSLRSRSSSGCQDFAPDGLGFFRFRQALPLAFHVHARRAQKVLVRRAAGGHRGKSDA